MPTNTITLTRQELYEQVWTTPMRKLAASYGLSDVGLAKICDNHDIPRPERGHWAKKEFGKEPPRTPLPACDDPELQTVRLLEREPREPGPRPKPPEPEYDEDVTRALERARGLPKVAAPAKLRNRHPLVEGTREALEDAKPDEHNLVGPRWDRREKSLCMSVGKASVRRALAFLDALVKAVERVGGKVEVVTGQWSRETAVWFCGEKVTTIRLRERYKQVERTTPPKDRWDWNKCEFVPTGRLLLDRGPSSYGTPFCQDTEKGRRIEDGINGAIVRWVEEVGRERIERRKAEEERRRRAEEERLRREREAELQRRREELLQRQRAEQARVDRLCADASAWKQSQALREYIAEVERVALARDGGGEAGGELARWLEWARQQADRLDPFTPSPPSVLDERI
jgi:hypothetical protein